MTSDYSAPPITSSGLRHLNVSYYEFGDRLIVSFSDPPRPGMNVAIDDGTVELRVTLDEDELIGIEIPNFVQSFLPQYPEYKEVAEAAGVPAESVDSISLNASSTNGHRPSIADLLNEFAGVDIRR